MHLHKYVPKMAERALSMLLRCDVSEVDCRYDFLDPTDNDALTGFEQLQDALADFEHFAVCYGIDFAEAVRMAHVHYVAEARGDDDYRGNDAKPVPVPVVVLRRAQEAEDKRQEFEALLIEEEAIEASTRPPY